MPLKNCFDLFTLPPSTAGSFDFFLQQISIQCCYVLFSGERYSIQVKFSCSSVGFYPATLAFEFKPDLQTPQDPFHIVRFIEAQFVTALGRELAPIAPYKPRSLPAWTPDFNFSVVDGVQPEGYRHSVNTLSNTQQM